MNLLPGSSTAPGSSDTDAMSAWQLWSFAMRHRVIIIVSVMLGTVIAAMLAWSAPPQYESMLTLRIDEKAPVPTLATITKLENAAGINTEMQMLRSRNLAEATVDSLSLEVWATTPFRVLGTELLGTARRVPMNEAFSIAEAPRTAQPARYRLTRGATDFAVTDRETGRPIGRLVAGKLSSLGDIRIALAPAALRYEVLDINVTSFARAVAGVQRNLRITRPQREANIVAVRFSGEDRQLAGLVPNVLAVKFIELRNQIMKTEARSTVAFLRMQIDTIGRQLSSTEDVLRAFREGNQVVSLTAEATVQVGELARLEAERNAKEGERNALARALEDARQQAERQGPDGVSAYRSLIAFPTLITTNASQFLQALNDAENQRAILLQRRTRTDRDVLILTARIRELEQQLSSIATTYLNGLSSQIASMDKALARSGAQLTRIPSKEIQLARLERQYKVLVEIYTLLQTRLQEAQIAQAVEDSRVRVVDMALAPAAPFQPSRQRYLMLGALFGLVAGVGLSFVRQAMDRTIHTREDMAAATGAISLGLIPHIDGAHPGVASTGLTGWRDLVSGAPAETRFIGVSGRDVHSPIVEAYRALRTNITFSRPDRPVRTLVLTSPTPGDGKTTSAANLAATLAHQGRRVLLVDADMRRGTMCRLFNIAREPGLSNVLIGAIPLREAIVKVDLAEMGILDVMPSGTFPPNPSELISSERMTKVLEDMRAAYEVVIFDSPPLNLVTDGAILGSRMDGVVLVGRAGATERGALTYAAELLQKVRAPLLGTILNDFNLQRDGRFSTYGAYGYYYSASYAGYNDAYGAMGDKEADAPGAKRRVKAKV